MSGNIGHGDPRMGDVVYSDSVLVLLVDTDVEMGIGKEMDDVDCDGSFIGSAFCSSTGRVTVHRTGIQLCDMVLSWIGYFEKESRG